MILEVGISKRYLHSHFILSLLTIGKICKQPVSKTENIKMCNIISYSLTNTAILPFIVVCNLYNDVFGKQDNYRKKRRKSHHYTESKNVDLIETENRGLIA